jgi:DNA polymerase-3 subunit alpha
MDRLMDRAVELGMSAMALTDHGNLFGAVSFVKQAEKRGIKPIIGCEGYMVTDHKNDERPGRENHKSYHLGLLAKNFQGYQNLCKVVSDAHVDGFYYRPRTDLETLAEHANGLIGFTGCMQGWIPQRRPKKPSVRCSIFLVKKITSLSFIIMALKNKPSWFRS